MTGAMLDKSAPLMGWAVNQCNAVWLEAISNPDAASLGELYWQEVLKAAKRAHREKKQQAANLGTAVHRALEARFKQDELYLFYDESDYVHERCNAALDWLQLLKAEPVAVERRIYSRRHGFVGTLDKLARINGELTLLDWKNSSGIWPEYIFQRSAYIGAFEEETGEKVMKSCLVRLGDDGLIEPHWFNRTSYLKDYRGFLGLLRGYKRLQEIKGEQSV